MTTNLSGARAGATNSVADIAGVRVGHAESGTSGATVVLLPDSAVAGVDVRGGGPGTRETDALRPDTTVAEAHAIVLAGGSAFGLAAADGVMQELSSRDIGFQVIPTLPLRVPIVPAAVIFDLLVGEATDRPTAETGAQAARAALDEPATEARGSIGVGRGASCGILKGGVGQSSLILRAGPAAGYTVAALLVTNAQGSGFDPQTGALWSDPTGAALSPQVLDQLGQHGYHGTKIPPSMLGISADGDTVSQANTTIGVVITDAPLSKAQAGRLATCGHDGLARAIRPIHMPFDGDTLFGVSAAQQTAQAEMPAQPQQESETHSQTQTQTPGQAQAQSPMDPYTFTALCDAAAVAVENAVVDALTHATGLAGWSAWSELVGPTMEQSE